MFITIILLLHVQVSLAKQQYSNVLAVEPFLKTLAMKGVAYYGGCGYLN